MIFPYEGNYTIDFSSSIRYFSVIPGLNKEIAVKVTIKVKSRVRTIRISADKLPAVRADLSTRGGTVNKIEPPKKDSATVARGFKQKPETHLNTRRNHKIIDHR